jgi:hypothetical protein
MKKEGLIIDNGEWGVRNLKNKKRDTEVSLYVSRGVKFYSYDK